MVDYPNIGDLTDKQRIFCEAYCRCWNATSAAIKAGYSEKTAYSIGSENLKKPECADYVQFIKDNAFEFAGVSILRNVQELSKIAYGSGADIRKAWQSLEDWESLPGDAKATIQEVTTVTRVVKQVGGDSDASLVQAIETVKVKQYDKLKAIEMLNKMGGFNAPEKIEVTEFEIDFNDSDSDED
jgi:phage terminase small subunit